MSTLSALLLIVSPIVIFFGAIFIRAKYFSQKIGVTPVEEPMLRAPGQSQRELIETLNEKMLERMMLLVVTPIFCALSFYQVSRYVAQSSLSIGVLFLISLTTVGYFSVRIFRYLHEYRNRLLGHAGECLVAERLQPLLKTGCLIFHDCPADKLGNIDHVVVAQSRVYAIETKTRRKRLSPETHRFEATVTYDGQSLIYPHGREKFGLDQARRQARWLSKLLSEALCETIPVEPVLALPGWYVDRIGRGDVYVVNPKSLPALIRERSGKPLSKEIEKRMEQIRFVLETRCRNVPFPGVISAREARKAANRMLSKQKAKAVKERAAQASSAKSFPHVAASTR